MYTKVSFKYENENIYALFVAVYPSICSEPYYIIMGMSYESSSPISIGVTGFFKDVSSALGRVSEIAEKYPRIDYFSDYPEFTGI